MIALTNSLITGGLTMGCVVSFYFIRRISRKRIQNFTMLAWCALAFLSIVILGLFFKDNHLLACIALAAGIAAGCAVVIPIYLVRKKTQPAPAPAAMPTDYPHFVADRLLNIGLHHVEFTPPESSLGYDLTAKDSYGQRACVRCVFSPKILETAEIEALSNGQKAGDFDRALLFTNAGISPKGKALAKQLQVELIEHFR